MREAMYIMLFLVACATVVAFIFVMLQPSKRVEKTVRPRAQFFLSDIFWLMLLMQLFLGMSSLIPRALGARMVVSGYLLLASLAMWWRGVTMLTGLGVFHVWRRAVFLIIVLPGAVLGGLAAGGIVVFALAPTTTHFALRLAAIIPIPLVCLAGRMLTKWVLAGSAPTAASQAVASDSSADEDVPVDSQ